jgi:hypothetical protein
MGGGMHSSPVLALIARLRERMMPAVRTAGWAFRPGGRGWRVGDRAWLEVSGRRSSGARATDHLGKAIPSRWGARGLAMLRASRSASSSPRSLSASSKTPASEGNCPPSKTT